MSRPRSDRATRLLLIAAAAAGLTVVSAAQQTAPPAKNPLAKLAEPWPDAAVMAQRKANSEALALFARDEPLGFTLVADFKTLNKDRNPESKKRYPAELRVDANGAARSIPVKLSARGHLRRTARTCQYVPLRIEFPDGQVKETPFQGQEAVKLIVQCGNPDVYEQFILREYLAYRVMNTVTPQSFRARLAKVTYVDLSGQAQATRYGLLLEDDSDVAKRMEGRAVELPRAAFADLNAQTLDQMMLSEYLIGNTDFSIYALHNVVLVQRPDRSLHPVPYDFDISGLVSPPYGVPDKRLPITDVQQRLYRGPCRSVEQFEAAVGPFRAQKDRILALPDTIADFNKDSRDHTRKFLNAFFDAIKDQREVKRTFVDGCQTMKLM